MQSMDRGPIELMNHYTLYQQEITVTQTCMYNEMLTYYEKKVKNSDGQQFHQYQQNKRKLKTVMVNNSTNINKTKES